MNVNKRGESGNNTNQHYFCGFRVGKYVDVHQQHLPRQSEVRISKVDEEIEVRFEEAHEPSECNHKRFVPLFRCGVATVMHHQHGR
jgi:hypothetical protein